MNEEKLFIYLLFKLIYLSLNVGWETFSFQTPS